MSRVVRVLPDQPALDKEFDYRLTEEVAEASPCREISIGTIVRVDLRGRRIRGWITQLDVEEPKEITLSEIKKVSGVGPPASLVSLAQWASDRWLGTRAHFLRTATHTRIVPALPKTSASDKHKVVTQTLAEESFRRNGAVVRVAPSIDDFSFAVAAASRGRALILAPTLARAQHLYVAMKRAGFDVALHPRDWPQSAAGSITIGTRSAAWAPIPKLDAVLVLDEHEESYQQESAPTWNARDVALERARRDKAPWVITSPSPSLEALTCGAPLLTEDRRRERDGWAIFDLIDLRDRPPSAGSWCSEELARVLRKESRVVCVLNRKGRARLAYCEQCGTLARSETSGKALGLEGDELVSALDGERRPAVCDACSSRRFRRAKLGVSGVAEELELLTRRPVTEITADDEIDSVDTDLTVGTEAVLHRISAADAVAFLDFDQELLAPRYRAAEEAMALLVRASRIVGGRANSGRVIVQTRVPDHPVLRAAVNGDPGSLARTELDIRRQLRQPPEMNWAIVSGSAAEEFVQKIVVADGLEIMGPYEGRWRIRSASRELLVEHLKAVKRPNGRLRIEINPLRA